MIHPLYADYIASISEFKKDPIAALKEANGEPLAILNQNEPAFYCVPRDLYEKLLDTLDDYHLIQAIQERKEEKTIAFSIEKF